MKQRPASPLPLPAPRECQRLREARLLPLAQVAAMVGVSVQTVRSWETGHKRPRGRKRRTYARLLTDWAARTPAPPRPRPRIELSPRQNLSPLARPQPADAHRPGQRAGSAARLTPHQAFDLLYEYCAPALVRQAYLLTGRRALARESVERAFQLAWQRWPEVAVDRDPAGWVRAAVHDCALSPWNRFRPRYGRREPPADTSDRALMNALLKLPPVNRRTLLLYDGIGLGLAEIAAETEASTPAAANRLLRAREAVGARVPEVAVPGVLHRRLAEVASAEPLRAARPPWVRACGERRVRRCTRAAIAFTTAIIGATALTLYEAPDHYESPVAEGRVIQDLPSQAAQGPLSDAERHLRDRLRSKLAGGPGRLVPEAR